MNIPDSLAYPKPPGQERTYPPPTKTGKVIFNVPNYDLPAETYYKIYGELDTGKTPLICLHGGPGVPHNYLMPISLVLVDYGIPVVLYDQIGCGLSTHFPDRMGDTAFWTPELFMAELDNLIQALGIKQFDIYGQSWGAMLGAQYAATVQPEGLRKLVAADGPASTKGWLESIDKLCKTLPKSVQEVLDHCIKSGKTDTPECRSATNELYKRYLCRLDSLPKELTDTFKEAAKDKTVFLTMWGPSDLVCTGSLDTWTIVEDLKKLTQKTLPGGILVINGLFDQAQDEAVLPYFKQPSAKAKWVEFALSAHFPHLEETEKFIKVLGRFLED